MCQATPLQLIRSFKIHTLPRHCDYEGTRLCCCRYMLSGGDLSDEQKRQFAALVHDRMTEQVYVEPLSTFKARPRSPTAVPLVPPLRLLTG